jgi:hypothetical protein
MKELSMQIQEVLQWISDNHRLLIVSGGGLSFISLFLPFWNGGAVWFEGSSTLMGSKSIPVCGTVLFWIFLILIAGLFYSYYQGYGEQYPNIFLAIGIGLFLLTFYAYQYKPEGFVQISVWGYNYGFFLELISSLLVVTGGYYYEINQQRRV